MDESPAATIENALNEANGLLRQQLAGHGLENTDYVMLAPDGGAVIRGNCGLATLRAVALLLMEIAGQVEADGATKPH